ncbi:uncharacterized protein LOC128673789 [Plodia interpunctella]|uniref:uncharacterized protein LOC128673789 n=1 Tax=Plodia interpunctella TaxID=58824 RepID=UPI002367ACAC|nr:uncharacterized protein LOC128673789 [Plodia interpunctella]
MYDVIMVNAIRLLTHVLPVQTNPVTKYLVQDQSLLSKFTMISLTRFIQCVNKSANVRLQNSALIKNSKNPNRIWSQIVMKNKKDGSIMNVKVQTVPKDRFEDFIDLKMNHFVKDEITYKVSGINDNPEAVKECRAVLKNMMSQRAVHIHGYFREDEAEHSELIGASSLILISKDDPLEEITVKTKEMKRFFEIVRAWNLLYKYDEVFKRYGIDCFYQDAGLVIHPKYRLLGIAKYEALVRRLVCIAHGVPATGAWCTMLGSQRASTLDDWDTLFEMSYDELASRLGVQFNDPPPSCKYMAVKVL